MVEKLWTAGGAERQPAELGKPLVDPAEWYPGDFGGSDSWIFRPSGAELADLIATVHRVQADGPAIEDIVREDCPLPILGAGMAKVRAELLEGRGFALVRGLPIGDMSRAATATAFWGLGSHLGRALAQNAEGHVLGHVTDLGGDYAKVRGYMTNAQMGFHTDQCDVLALTCLHPAKSGGAHLICSSVALHNEMLKRRPELVSELTWKFFRSRSGEIPAGETEPWYRQGIFNFHEGYFAARGVSANIAKAQAMPGVPPFTPAQIEAMELFKSLARELAWEVHFEPGDVFFLNCHVTLHSRGAYEDWPEPERRRHLLRLWLSTGGARPLPPDFDRQANGISFHGPATVAPLDA